MITATGAIEPAAGIDLFDAAGGRYTHSEHVSKNHCRTVTWFLFNATLIPGHRENFTEPGTREP